MNAAIDDVPPVATTTGFPGHLGRVGPMALLSVLLAVVGLQRGGYYAESWGLPTVACAWAVVVMALLGSQLWLSRLELLLAGAFVLLGALSLGSAAWAPGGLTNSLPPSQLIALYAAFVTAVMMLFRRATPLIVALWAALLAISLVALAARLFPARGFESGSGGNRLYEPLGYWNSLGLWAAMALLLGLVLAIRGRSILLRATAAAGCVPCATTLYFTFSRGAWVAFVAGFLAALALDPRRVGLIASMLVAMLWPALAIVAASRSNALTSVAPSLDEARKAGHSLAAILIALSLAGALTAVLFAAGERRWRIPVLARRGFTVFLLVSCLFGVIGGSLRYGPPWTVVGRVAHGFEAPPKNTNGDLNQRLLDTSGNFRVDVWHVAWRDARRHPFLGSGAGSFVIEWYRDRPLPLDLTNAHELYLETLAELGPGGLALLLVVLSGPLIAARRARRHPLAPGVFAAYVAFLVHAGADWDWQLAAVTLAALTSGVALLVMARDRRGMPVASHARIVLVAAAATIALFTIWSLSGAYALGEARDALVAGRWAAAAVHAQDASRRVGGSSAVPWMQLGEAETALGHRQAALLALRQAVARDPSSWQAWYDLALIARGRERSRATAAALSRNPLGSDTRALAHELGIGLPRA